MGFNSHYWKKMCNKTRIIRKLLNKQDLTGYTERIESVNVPHTTMDQIGMTESAATEFL